MAEKKKPKSAKAKATKPKAAKAAAAKRTTAKKRAAPKAQQPAAKAKPAPRRASGPTSSTFDITKLIDHPLVADLLAVGAMAAVAAIADHHVKTRTGEAQSGSSKAVKSAGKAAATAIGKRLMTELDAVRKASKPKESKRGSK